MILSQFSARANADVGSYQNVFNPLYARSVRRQMRVSRTITIAIVTLLTSAALLIPSAYSGPYRYYEALMSDFKTLSDSHPGLVTFETVGKTVQDKDIVMVKIGNPSCDGILVDGAIHGWETLGSELLYFFVEWLLTSNDPLAVQILAKSYILMIPGVDVDKFNIARTNVNGVDLNRNFATNWYIGGSSDPTNEYYRGAAPLSEPESQTLVQVFEKYRPKFYLNLHFGPGGAQYYFGSSYGNRTYYSIITSRIRSVCQQRGVVPYPYSGEAGSPGFAISDAARVGITSFLVELMDQIIPLSEIESVVLPRFITMVEVLSQECESFKDDFENGDFSRWSGIYVSQGETSNVVEETTYENLHSAKFSSDGTSLFEASYCYKTFTPLSDVQVSAYFKVTSSGIKTDDARFYVIVLKIAGNGVASVGWRQVAGVVKWNLLIRNGTEWVSEYSESSPSMNKWFSVRLTWFEDSLKGNAELYIDGILTCSIENMKTTSFDQTDFRFGLAEIYNCRNTTVYCDSCGVDIARTRARAGVLGDISGPTQGVYDGIVNMRDINYVILFFNTTASSPNWKPNADINNDGTVNMRDIQIQILNFNKHE